MPKKFQTLECNVCKRRVDKEFTPKIASFPKCTITYGCLGALKKVAEKDVGNLQSSYEYGLENWRPRNQNYFNDSEIEEDVFIPITSTSNRSFTIGVDPDLLWIDPFTKLIQYDTIELSVLQMTNKSQIQIEYLYNVSNAATNLILSGADSSSDQKTLSFDSTYDIFVFLNGNQLIENTNNGFSTYLSNTLLPVNAIQILTHVPALSKIIVLKRKKGAIEKKSLTFKSNQSLQNVITGAWSNVNEISTLFYINGTAKNKKYILFTLENPNELGNDVRLQFDYSKSDGIVLKKQNFSSRIKASADPTLDMPLIGVLANKPFSIKDRNYNFFYDFFSLTKPNNAIKFFKAHDVFEWHINSNSLAGFKSPIEIVNFILLSNKPVEDNVILQDSSNDKYKIKYKLKSPFII